MKKILVLLLMSCLLSTAFAAPINLESKLDAAEISAGVNTNDILVEDLLKLLSAKSGITIMAVPEAAAMRVTVPISNRQKLKSVLDTLCQNYGLIYQLNDQKNAVIVLKGNYYSPMYRSPLAPSPLLGMGNAPQQKMMSEAAILPGGCYKSADFNTEEYNRIYDNSYQDAASSPLSTFSIDVDTASYSNVRRFLNSGYLPTKDAVRTEEMINYFTYKYNQPTGSEPFSVTTEVSRCPWQPQHQLVMIGLQGKDVAVKDLPPSNLVFLIDVSGSMGEPNKLPLLKTAFKMMVKQLRLQDRVSIVTYAGQAGVVLQSASGKDKDKIIAAIDNLEAGGSTAGGEGINLAYKLAKENFIKNGNNRVILATDGDFNVGVSSEGELTRMIEERRDDGIFLSVLGFGMGNLKDNKMETLADKGNGNYAYIDTAQEAKRVMVGQLAGTLYTIAKDVKLQVEFNPAKVKYYRLVGYENRVLDKKDFNDDKKDAGDMGAGQVVTAFYEIILAGSAENAGSTDQLLYQHSQVIPSNDLLQVKIRYKKPADKTSVYYSKAVGRQEFTEAPSENFRFAAAVAEYSMLLRSSEFKGNASYSQVLDLANSAKGQDYSGDRAEFIKMVEISQVLESK